jgi:hypothetical protein
MKKFDLLSDEEVLALTQEEIQSYSDLACAEAGVPFLPPKPEKPKNDGISPDKIVFEVSGFCVDSTENFLKIAEFIRSNNIAILDVNYVPGPGCNKKIYGYKEEITYNSRSVFSEDHWEKIGAEKEKYEEQKAEYETANDEWETINRKRETEVQYISDRINKIYENQRNKQRYIEYFNQYLVLAKGDKEIAMSFLRKAYPKIEDYPELIDQLTEGVV